MSSRPSVALQGAGKRYRQFTQPVHRLLDLLGWRQSGSEPVLTHALEPLNLTLEPGEALGVVGLNGAGKSTLLQLIAGTLLPSEGRVERRGRVAALLELGSGFEPDFTGRENILLNAAALGLTEHEIADRMDAIIAFSGIGSQIDHPIKTYSSGMVVRLAFSVATSVVPDILIIDEALSVGDGAFARKSFDRVMEIKRAGATVVFCSHTLFHVEVFCDRALWLHQGRAQAMGSTASVLSSYQAFLDDLSRPQEGKAIQQGTSPAVEGSARIEGVQVLTPGGDLMGLVQGSEGCHRFALGEVSFDVRLSFASQGSLPPPTAAVVISTEAGRILATSFSASSLVGGPGAEGEFRAQFRQVPLNRGRYRIGAYLLCERAQHVYQWVDPVAEFEVEHTGLDQGYLRVHADWSVS